MLSGLKKPRKWTVFEVIAFIILAAFAITIIFPILWSIMTSFKGNLEFRENKFGLPQVWEFENYLVAIQNFKVVVRSGEGLRTIMIFEMLFNTLMYAVGGTFFYMLCHYLMAYVTAIYPNKFSKFLYWMMLTLIVVPISNSSAATVDLAKNLGIYDNWFGFFFMRFQFTGMYFLILHESIKTTSKAITEAAEIDGAGRWRIMFQIVLPQMKGVMATISLITFIASWNDYMNPKLYLPTHPTIAYGLFEYIRSGNNAISGSISMRLTGCMIIFIPIFILFICFRNKLMGNLSYGAVKE